MRYQKKGVALAPEFTGKLILLVAVLLASVFITTKVIDAANQQSTPQNCYVNTLLNSRLKETFTGQSVVEWQCPINGPIKIKEKTIFNKPKNWKKVPWNIIPKATIEAYGGKGAFNPPEFRYAYNTERFVAKEMKDCWIKSGYGNEQLFDNMITGIEWDPFQEDGSMLPGFSDPPLICGICTIFYFDEKPMEMLDEQNINTITPDEYLRRHPYAFQADKSYWEFLELNKFESSFIGDKSIFFEFEPSGIEDPLAVAFVRLPALQIAKAGRFACKEPEITGALLGFFGGGGGYIGKAVGGSVGWMLGGAVKLDNKNDCALLDDLADGMTTLKIVKVSELRDNCNSIANSLSDKNLETVSVFG